MDEEILDSLGEHRLRKKAEIELTKVTRQRDEIKKDAEKIMSRIISEKDEFLRQRDLAVERGNRAMELLGRAIKIIDYYHENNETTQEIQRFLNPAKEKK